MISIDEYFKTNNVEHRFTVPLSFFEHLKFLIIKTFFFFLPLKDRIYIDSRVKSFYWEIIYGYLYKNFKVKVQKGYLHFDGMPIIKTARLYSEDPKISMSGFGNSLESEGIAVSVAIGEFLERNIMSNSSFAGESYLYKMDISDIRQQAKLVSDFNNFSAIQKEEHAFLGLKENIKISVVIVEDLQNSKKIFYPAQSVFIDSRDWGQEEGLISEVNTNGCGGGFTLDMATLSALYECIERDGFLTFWMTKSVPTKIEVEKGEVEAYDLLRLRVNKRNKYEIFFLDITTDISIPSVACLVKNKATGGICVSAGADLLYKEAIRKATIEMYSCLPAFQSQEVFSIEVNEYRPFLDMSLNKSKRVLLSTSGKHYENFEFLLEGKTVRLSDIDKSLDISFSGDNEKIKFILDKLKSKGGDYQYVYRYVSRNKILSDLGYFVVRIIVPKLLGLHLLEGFTPVVSQRLKEFNLWKNGKENFDLNTFPHPFP